MDEWVKRLDSISSNQTHRTFSNAEIADRLASLAQLLSLNKEDFYKFKAYRRAANVIRMLPESIDELVRDNVDLTSYEGIGKAIAGSIREIVLTGSLTRLKELQKNAPAPLAEFALYPRLDPKRVLRIYKKLNISTVEELRQKLESGEIQNAFGSRMAHHVLQGITEIHGLLLYQTDALRSAIEHFLVDTCKVRRCEVAGDYRRRVEVIEELVFVVASDTFSELISRVERYGGKTQLLSSSSTQAVFALSSGVRLRLQLATDRDWGYHMIICTGAESHVRKLTAPKTGLRALKASNVSLTSETVVYRKLGLRYIEPELREGYDEIDRARKGTLPDLVTTNDIRGELHAHTLSSDGGDSLEGMAEAARLHGYDFIGITDHSQSLKIARGVSILDLLAQLRHIDKLNAKLRGIHILKSAEVDILADGSLDYPDEVLQELDYTVCSVHSRFNLGKIEQTERILRAMDNRYFNILGHATGRLLLKRPGYEIEIERVIQHARANGCFFEINSSPDRLDLSSVHARQAAEAGVLLAVSTDAHSTGELDLLRCGIDQARRAGLQKSGVLNCRPWKELQPYFKR